MKAGSQKGDASALFGNSADPEAQPDSPLSQASGSTSLRGSSSSIEGNASPNSARSVDGTADSAEKKESTHLTLVGHDGDTSIVPVRKRTSRIFFTTYLLPITIDDKGRRLTPSKL